MYGASNSLADNLPNPEMQSPKAKYSAFLSLIERAKNYSKSLTFWEMHSLASLLPDWMHHLSYQQIEAALESFTHGKFIPFIQQGYKEAFGEICRQAYLHGRLYHLLEHVAIDKQTAEVIKDEVKAEVLEASKTRSFAKFFGAKSLLAVHVDREPQAKNTEAVDSILADAVVEAACKKMSHPVEDLKKHQEIHQLAKRAIMQCLAKSYGDKELTLSIPQAKGHGCGAACDVNFVYDMASFILSNKK